MQLEILWKGENVFNEFDDLIKKIFGYRVESVGFFQLFEIK